MDLIGIGDLTLFWLAPMTFTTAAFAVKFKK